ncbi:hypothetical protein B0J11DRAFT_590087 [Dendryphion nanum]|uniref:Uncharacterized protein n=1 Tax=Dendryphion nanum TaxID=256645 RepID=A0A9P9DLK0_9PLEO|nr:hypothetical protein B0J11DRAFT_590087 [Dendryphion nanum]
MKYSAIVSIAELFFLASAAPTQSPSNFEVAAIIPDHFPSIHGTPQLVKAGDIVPLSKRSIEKRAGLYVDIWIHPNQVGRHEALWTETQRCYGIGNGWNDEISSLSVPNGFGCTFFRDGGCSDRDEWLIVPGGNYIPDLTRWNFDNKISSYICY